MSVVVTQSRKQREILQRNDLILDVARKLLLERGYLGLTMDRVAAATEYSKGTIYQHFKNKEEILSALVIQTARKRTDLFERAATFKGRPRERMAAIGQAADLFVTLYPDHFKAEHVVRASSIRDKIAPEKQRAMELCEHRCLTIASGVVRDAVAQGDLQLPPDTTPEQVSFGLWCMTLGAWSAMSAQVPFEELGFPQPLAVLHKNQQFLLDGYGWQPLSTEWDYEQTYERIHAELFAEEMRQVEAMGAS